MSLSEPEVAHTVLLYDAIDNPTLIESAPKLVAIATSLFAGIGFAVSNIILRYFRRVAAHQAETFRPSMIRASNRIVSDVSMMPTPLGSFAMRSAAYA